LPTMMRTPSKAVTVWAPAGAANASVTPTETDAASVMEFIGRIGASLSCYSSAQQSIALQGGAGGGRRTRACVALAQQASGINRLVRADARYLPERSAL